MHGFNADMGKKDFFEIGSIAVVKKTFRYPNVFFYNRLYRNSMFRNFIMESGIIKAHGIHSAILKKGGAL
jgi:hypothetical protein